MAGQALLDVLSEWEVLRQVERMAEADGAVIVVRAAEGAAGVDRLAGLGGAIHAETVVVLERQSQRIYELVACARAGLLAVAGDGLAGGLSGDQRQRGLAARRGWNLHAEQSLDHEEPASARV